MSLKLKKKKSAAQLDREIADVLAPPKELKLKDRASGGHVWLTFRDGRVVGVMGSDPARYMKMTVTEARHLARYGGRGHRGSSHSTIKLDKDDARMYGRQAYRMEQTKEQALSGARETGFAPHHLGAVEDGWDAERRDTIHGGFVGGSHATKKLPRRVAYRLKLSPSEMKAVEFARGRYAWPDMLSTHAAEDGSIAFTESEMWQWTDDVDSDAAGGHSPFPLAAPAFVDKLQSFYDERV